MVNHRERSVALARQILSNVVTAVVDSKIADSGQTSFSREDVVRFVTRDTLADCGYDLIDRWLLNPKEETLQHMERTYEGLTGIRDGSLAEYLSLNS